MIIIKNKHLTLSDRVDIEVGLKQQRSLTEIANDVDKTVSSIRYEIKQHSIKTYPSTFNGRNICKFIKDGSCVVTGLCNIDTCTKFCKTCKRHPCNERCPKFEEYICDKLTKKPYCCNGCDNYKNCRNIKIIYYANDANNIYQKILVNSRKGPRITQEEIDYINNVVSKRVKNGQSFSNIKMYDHNVKSSVSSLYKYTDNGLFEFKNIDLPKKVTYKLRKKDNKDEYLTDEHLNNIDILKLSRSYDEFLVYSNSHQEQNIVEMDTVEGIKGGKMVLTFLFRKSNFMIAFLINNKKAMTVKKKIDYLKKTISLETFILLFRIILTDNGVEFSMIKEIEALENDQHINLFFCDSGKSNQKGKIEKNHEEFRKILPKGTSFDNLTQSNINLVMSHVNSYRRKSLGNISPYQALVNQFGKEFADELMSLLNYKVIPDEDIILKPKLLKKSRKK